MDSKKLFLEESHLWGWECWWRDLSSVSCLRLSALLMTVLHMLGVQCQPDHIGKGQGFFYAASDGTTARWTDVFSSAPDLFTEGVVPCSYRGLSFQGDFAAYLARWCVQASSFLDFSSERSTAGSCLGLFSGDCFHSRWTFPGVHFPVFPLQQGRCPTVWCCRGSRASVREWLVVGMDIE